MTRKRLRIYLVAFAALLAAYGFSEKGRLMPFRLTGFAQGTTYAVTYYATDSAVSTKEVNALFERIDSSLSLYKSWSLINGFNQSDSGVVADKYLKEVVEHATAIHRSTNGLFDVTVKPLVEAWGFGAKPLAERPSEENISAIKACIGQNKIGWRGDFLIKQKRCVQLDLNGIGQGYSVDLLVGLLEARGINNYLVEIGGEVRCKGRKQPNGERWAIGIEAPSNNPFDVQTLIKTIHLNNGALTTSGVYRQYKKAGGKRVSHLINPVTAQPVDNELLSVTVWAPDATTADGYDNAFMLMGLSASLQFLKKEKAMAAYFIYTKRDGSVADTASAGFGEMDFGFATNR